MIESVVNTSRQSSADRNSFGCSCAVTKLSTRATRSLEHLRKSSPTQPTPAQWVFLHQAASVLILMVPYFGLCQ
ncbi:hypothetical protein COP1_028334 [Malus domestica]